MKVLIRVTLFAYSMLILWYGFEFLIDESVLGKKTILLAVATVLSFYLSVISDRKYYGWLGITITGAALFCFELLSYPPSFETGIAPFCLIGILIALLFFTPFRIIVHHRKKIAQ